MSKKGSFSKQKFEDRVQQEINVVLRGQISDNRLRFVSITKVELNTDNSSAKVFWDTFEIKSKGDIKSGLKAATGKIRSLIAKSLGVRHVPQLEFVYDSQFEDQAAIEKLLESEKN